VGFKTGLVIGALCAAVWGCGGGSSNHGPDPSSYSEAQVAQLAGFVFERNSGLGNIYQYQGCTINPIIIGTDQVDLYREGKGDAYIATNPDGDVGANTYSEDASTSQFACKHMVEETLAENVP
jgi:hypothetical protein